MKIARRRFSTTVFFVGKLLFGGLLASAVDAAELNVTLAVPTLKVAEYHRPYVAVWLENETTKDATTLVLWYDVAARNNEGNKWLKDLRQWWRKTGRTLNPPLDGVTGATRNEGEHTLTFSDAQAPLRGLAAGNYRLYAEAAREVGGREVVQVSFTWPPKKPETLSATGKEELGPVTLKLKP